MKHILTIVGARPQFIKAAAISHAIRDLYGDELQEDILHTGQHYDEKMSAAFFGELDLPRPRYNLGVGSGSHGAQTAAMLKGAEEVLLSEHYDGALVYGDTNSTLAGALAAAKLGVPVFHVEAGLRSHNRAMPEEINRVLTDHLSHRLFAPTATAVENLRKEGFDEERIVRCGDVMLDNVYHYQSIAVSNSRLPTSNSPIILTTIHRDFNTDNPERLKNIIAALNTIAEQYDSDILFPLHPRTKKIIGFMGSPAFSNRICITEPLSYLETLSALQQSRLVLTDSGGLQKEANFCDKCCVVLRPETEWVELIDDGAAILADADQNRILSATQKLIDRTPIHTQHFGDGNAAKKIIEKILSYL